MTPDIERLKELAEQLPDLTAMVYSKSRGVTEYDVVGGKSTGWVLDNCEVAALQKNIMTPGTTFMEHTHDAKEVLVILEGEGTFVSEGKKSAYAPRDVIAFPPGCPHMFHAETTTVMYAVTLPPCKGYPGVR